jgi:peptide chain release factor 2
MEVDIDSADLLIDSHRISATTEQPVKHADSAVCITHEPTGIVAVCQSERSHEVNRDHAMKILRSTEFILPRKISTQVEESLALQVGGGHEDRPWEPIRSWGIGLL